ncbi:hypothetical protein EP331_02280 [bacterium]|nr:MAG: hypothetical protein EP331_02280 [bacterium]
MHSTKAIWISAPDFSVTFDEVKQLADSLISVPETIWFYSNCPAQQLVILLAYWLRGSALAPVSPQWNTEVQERFITLTKAVFIEDIPATFNSNPSSISCFIQTSGTSSFPKIVPISRQMFDSAVKTTSEFLPAGLGDSWLLNLPLHHVGGLSILLRAWFMKYTVFIPPVNDKDFYKQAISQGLCNYISLVPTQLQRLLSEQIVPHPKFKRVLLGGGPVSVSVLQSALNSGFTIVNSFGMSETAAQITGKLYQANNVVNSVSVGLPIDENPFRITSEQEPFEATTEGLLWFKGKQVFDSYSSKESALFDGDWFCTGDFAKLNTIGELEILMRRTDRIVSGGENINPIEIEQILETHPSVQECLVTGKPDEIWGEKLVALCVLNGNLDTKELKTFLKERLEAFKIPKEFISVDELPRISISKLDRKTARELVKY